MANARDKARAAEQDNVEPEGNDAQRNEALANEATPATEPGGDDVASGEQGGSGEAKPKRKRKTLEEKIEEMRQQYEASERKRKSRVIGQIKEVEERLRKEKSKVEDLTKERNDLRASIGLSPEDVDLTEQGPSSAEILADPVAAGDTTAAGNARS